MAVPIYISINNIGRFLFFTSSPVFVICVFCVVFDDSLWQGWGDISLWFSLVFPWWLVMLSIFSCANWAPAFPLWKKCPFRSFACFSIEWVFFFLMLSYISCLYILDMNHIICKYFLPFSRLPFHFSQWFPLLYKSFEGWLAPFWFLISLGLEDRSKKYCYGLCQRVWARSTLNFHH